MSADITVGIVGGYGASGRVVVTELGKSTPWQIRIGGRDLTEAQSLADEFGSGRVAAARVDVLDANSLNTFCDRCSIIVNCAGPVSALQDRVAQAAFRNRCHYIDPAGMSFVKERMLAHNEQITQLGLSFVVSAGWIPGLSELLPLYAYARASATMDPVESVTVYYGDSGEWSASAFRDIVWFLRSRGLRRPQHFRKGELASASMRQASPTIELGAPIGRRRFSMITMPELEAVGRRLNTCDFFAYAYLPSLRVALTGALIASIPLPEDRSVSLLQKGFRQVSTEVGGFVVVRVRGRAQGKSQMFTTQVVYEKHLDYWTHGLVLATVARMVCQKQVKPGVHFLADAVDPESLMAELRSVGIGHTEHIEAQ